MMPLKNTIEKLLAVMLHVSRFAQTELRAEKPIATDHTFFFCSLSSSYRSFISFIFGKDHMTNAAINIYVGTKEISERNKNAKNKTAKKTADENYNIKSA